MLLCSVLCYTILFCIMYVSGQRDGSPCQLDRYVVTYRSISAESIPNVKSKLIEVSHLTMEGRRDTVAVHCFNVLCMLYAIMYILAGPPSQDGLVRAIKVASSIESDAFSSANLSI